MLISDFRTQTVILVLMQLKGLSIEDRDLRCIKILLFAYRVIKTVGQLHGKKKENSSYVGETSNRKQDLEINKSFK